MTQPSKVVQDFFQDLFLGLPTPPMHPRIEELLNVSRRRTRRWLRRIRCLAPMRSIEENCDVQHRSNRAGLALGSESPRSRFNQPFGQHQNHASFDPAKVLHNLSGGPPVFRGGRCLVRHRHFVKGTSKVVDHERLSPIICN